MKRLSIEKLRPVVEQLVRDELQKKGFDFQYSTSDQDGSIMLRYQECRVTISVRPKPEDHVYVGLSYMQNPGVQTHTCSNHFRASYFGDGLPGSVKNKLKRFLRLAP